MNKVNKVNKVTKVTRGTREIKADKGDKGDKGDPGEDGKSAVNLGDWYAGLFVPLPGHRADGRQLLAVHGAGRDG